MKRRRRRLVTLMVLLSLALAVGVGVTWARAQRVMYLLAYVTETRKQYQVQVFPHALVFGVYWRGPTGEWPESGFRHYRFPLDGNFFPTRAANVVLGFGVDRQTDSVGGVSTRVDVPYWALLVVTVGFPVMVIVSRVRTRRRRGAGLCVECGYDLRGSAGRCPECGAVREEPSPLPSP